MWFFEELMNRVINDETGEVILINRVTYRSKDGRDTFFVGTDRNEYYHDAESGALYKRY